MQQTRELNSSSSSAENQRLRDKHVRDLMVEKRRLVEVSYRASLAHTMNALVANRVVAVPVAAPPGHWIGADDQMDGGDVFDLDQKMAVPVSSIIGHCLEGLRLCLDGGVEKWEDRKLWKDGKVG
uniref:Uncharacterized protein n=1 Tax=Quercus lobata TaxID=97700 RepID=A0A7N2LQ35_QUELO